MRLTSKSIPLSSPAGTILWWTGAGSVRKRWSAVLCIGVEDGQIRIDSRVLPTDSSQPGEYRLLPSRIRGYPLDWINTAKIHQEHRRYELARPFLSLGAVSMVSFVVVSGLVFSRLTQTADAQLALSINQAYLGSAVSALMVLAAEYGREYFWIPVVAVMLVFGDRRTKFLAMEL